MVKARKTTISIILQRKEVDIGHMCNLDYNNIPIGISTASLYPMETEKALIALGEMGVRYTEIFFNSPCELKAGFLKEINAIKDAYGMEIVSVHPFTSSVESFMVFSDYIRRFNDMREFYLRYYEAAAAFGASYVIIHGERAEGDLPAAEYCRRFLLLDDDAKLIDKKITVTQENVNAFRTQSPDFIKMLRSESNDRIKFTFDVKQSVRAGYALREIIEAMGSGIAHVHISDHDEKRDCLLPGDGNCDFKKLFSHFINTQYVGYYLIEVYKNAFADIGELKNSFLNLKSLYIDTFSTYGMRQEL